MDLADSTTESASRLHHPREVALAFDGIAGHGWFLGVHCFAKYVKVGFFSGRSLRPLPPGESKTKGMRYLDIHEDDPLDEDLVASWILQASELPGWIP
ncbi:MAG: hypothetical protein EXS13_04085 [Planctomycetes bacterium]|nr:hypothetical protein [Planctomycetota bacterium]